MENTEQSVQKAGIGGVSGWRWGLEGGMWDGHLWALPVCWVWDGDDLSDGCDRQLSGVTLRRLDKS